MRGPDFGSCPCQASAVITGLLRQWQAGEPQALDRFVEAVYPELRRMADRQCRHESRASTLECTDVVHEAWLRLAQAEPRSWKNRSHFFGFASRLMRHILVDSARSRCTRKRGGTVPAVAFADEDGAAPGAPDGDMLDLDLALDELAKVDPLRGRIVRLRYFSGLTIPETARVTGLSESTVKREWNVARAWIRRRLLERSPAVAASNEIDL